jgi:hypothetical protein
MGALGRSSLSRTVSNALRRPLTAILPAEESRLPKLPAYRRGKFRLWILPAAGALRNNV